MGILNVTPDSFSDHYPEKHQALDHARQLIKDGAEIIDVGGESTRPGSDPIQESLELARVIPVIEALAAETDVLISVDTQKPGVARAAMAAGAHIVNHVSASLDYAIMIPVIQETGAGYVAMHMRERPKTMQKNIVYGEVVSEVGIALQRVRDACRDAHISSDRLVFDPGIGFGKTLEHNLTLMKQANTLSGRLGRPLLMGISRKSWLVKLLENDLPDMAERDAYTALASTRMPFPAVAIHRVHNVALVSRAFRLVARL
jgi:dihydropteroate synthase